VRQKRSCDRAFHADCDARNDFDMCPNIIDHHDQLMIMTVVGFIVFIVIIVVALQKVSYDRAFDADCDARNFYMCPNIIHHHDQLMIMTV
jgi:hypothetical protein